MDARAEIDALWSVEGQVAALAACVVALADALGLEVAGTLDDRLSAEDFDFSAVAAALAGSDAEAEAEAEVRGPHVALTALLAEAGFASIEALHDPSLEDTAFMITCHDSLSAISVMLGESVDALLTLTEVHQLDAQGLWLAQYLSAALQGQMMLLATRDALPAQVPANIRATAPMADALSLTVPDLPWTADRWPLADQVSALQSLCGVLQGFGLDLEGQGVLGAATACISSGYAPATLRSLHLKTADALDGLNRVLDQWSPTPNPALASEPEVALVQGALARARDVLEQATGEPE